jgi:hypothetical protein
VRCFDFSCNEGFKWEKNEEKLSFIEWFPNAVHALMPMQFYKVISILHIEWALPQQEKKLSCSAFYLLK